MRRRATEYTLTGQCSLASSCPQRNFIAYTQPLDRAHVRAFKSSIRSEVAKHFAEFFLEAVSNFERANLDSTTSVPRQLLLSFVHTAAQNADSPQHRTAGWRFIDWQNELGVTSARVLVRVNRVVVVCCCFLIHPFLPLFPCLHVFRQFPSLALRIGSNDQCDSNQCCSSIGGCLRWHHPGVELAAQCVSTRENSPGSDAQ